MLIVHEILKRGRNGLVVFVVLSGWLVSGVSVSLCQDRENAKVDEKAALEKEQQELAANYKLLEEKLFSLYEFEKGQNPIRSKLLKQAYLQSQQKMTTQELRRVVGLMERSKLKDAEKGQAVVLLHLNDLLELLQSEDRGKRVRDEIKRHQEYLKEVDRLLRIQKGLRGQTEGGVDQQRLANSQKKTADRTNKLAQEIRSNEETGNQDSKGSDSQGNPVTPKAEQSDSEKGQGKKDESGQEDESADQKSSKEMDSEKSNRSSDGQGKKSDGPSSSDEQDNDSGKQSGSSKSGTPKPGSGSPAPDAKPSESGNSPDQQPSEDGQNPVRKRIAAAEEKMRSAQRRLEDAERDGAIEKMQEAERELAAARKELEEILRQLREEEIERSLAALESRFRVILERQIKVYDSTKKMDRVDADQRGTDFEIKAGRLSQQQNSIAKETGRALMLLLEDGSSVAFPATVEEMQLDMSQVASRLGQSKVGRITINIEEDIIETLDYLIEALVKTQQDLQKMKKSRKPGNGEPGDRPLVDKLAEIKMLRGLQQRIYRRHKRYAEFNDDPSDPVGQASDPDMKAALERLAEKQNRLMRIAKDIVKELNQ